MPQFFAVTTNRYLQFTVDIAASAFLTYVLSALVWRLIGSGGQGGVFLVMFVPGLLSLLLVMIAAPFFVLPILGAGRFGFVLGPVILAAATYATSSLVLKQKEDAFAKLTNLTVEPLRSHTLLAIQDNNKGTLCDETCIKVLATSNHTLALGGDGRGDRTWTLYTQTVGAACFTKENAKLALEFLVHGFPDRCAERKSISDFEDGLFLRIVWPDARRRSSPGLPEGFTGAVYEYFERIDGNDRFLARHIKGGLGPMTQSLLLVEKRPPTIDAGPPIDRMSFLANAIGSDVSSLNKNADPFPLDNVLSGIEKYFDHKEAIGVENLHYARWAWSQVAVNARAQTEILKERILPLLVSRDPLRIDLGLQGIYALPFNEQRTFPDDVMLDLMFVPLGAEASVALKEHLERQFAPGRAPPSIEVRERAKAHLADPDLASWKLRLLQQISER